MQAYVHQQQRKLKEHLEDAAEWASARLVAAAERETDWQTVCRAADGDCAHGDACGCAKMLSLGTWTTCPQRAWLLL